MTVRFYPEREGTTDKNGITYPFMVQGTIHESLQKVIAQIKELCHQRSLGLLITSLNDGDHMKDDQGHPISMHARGLAMDYNIYKIINGKATRQWLTFREQADIGKKALENCGYDGWIWVADPEPDGEPTHTHLSIHH